MKVVCYFHKLARPSDPSSWDIGRQHLNQPFLGLISELVTFQAQHCTMRLSPCKGVNQRFEPDFHRSPHFPVVYLFQTKFGGKCHFHFLFLVLPQISLVKYYETIKILMQIFSYFKLHFHNEGLDCQKNYFEMFFLRQTSFIFMKNFSFNSLALHVFL